MKFTLFQIHKKHQKVRTDKELQFLLEDLWLTLENFTLKEIIFKNIKGCKHIEETKKSKTRSASMPSPIWGDERKFGPASALCSSSTSQQSPAMMQFCTADINLITAQKGSWTQQSHWSHCSCLALALVHSDNPLRWTKLPFPLPDLLIETARLSLWYTKAKSIQATSWTS